MKHETREKETLDSFKIDINDLDELIGKLRGEFPDEKKLCITIDFHFGKDSYEFDNVQEIKGANIQYDQCNDYRIDILGENKHFYISNRSYNENESADITAIGDQASWCAGINEIAKSYLKTHRSPLYWMGRFWTIFLLFVPIGILLMSYNKPTNLESLNGIISLIILCALLTVWRLIRKKLAPSGLIFLKEKPRQRTYWLNGASI